MFAYITKELFSKKKLSHIVLDALSDDNLSGMDDDDSDMSDMEYDEDNDDDSDEDDDEDDSDDDDEGGSRRKKVMEIEVSFIISKALIFENI